MPKDVDPLEEIDDLSKFFGIDSKEKSSLAWFRKNMQYIYGSVGADAAMDGSKGKIKEDGRPGKLYMFRYSPKTKKKLPYYDAFPMAVLLTPPKKEMMGINLHYLPPKYREIFFSSLLAINSDNSLSDSARFKVSYDILKGSSKFRFFKPCIKKYLMSKVRSEMVIIPPKYWNIAVNLPTEAFVKQKKQAVWKESINKIR